MTAVPDINEPVLSVRRAALEAYEAGLCPIPAKTDGSKAPFGLWKRYQDERPPREQFDVLFTDDTEGFGIICGAVSGGIEMFEFEAGAVKAGMVERFRAACIAAGIGELWEEIVNGYLETTPSGGLHTLLAVDGDCHGNLKLARRRVGSEIEVLIETRGEGGFTIAAPSHGSTHPSGKAWVRTRGSFDTVVIVTVAERNALYDVARSFDELSPRGDSSAAAEVETVVSTSHQSIPLRPVDPNRESWMDAVCAKLDQRSWREVLEEHGFAHVKTDAQGEEYYKRPGKDDDGYSVTVNHNGKDRMIVFSSSMPDYFTPYDGIGKAPSYDRLDVIAAYDYNGDRIAAGRALRGENHSAHLPDNFWKARPMLAHIRQAALSRMISPDAVLAAVLTRVVAMSHHTITLPPIVGRRGSPDLYIAVLAGPSIGKGSSMDTAADLLPRPPTLGSWLAGRFVEVPVGSGEGIVKAFFAKVATTDENGRRHVGPPQQVAWNALIRIDEAESLERLAKRQDQTTMSILRSAWSRETIGPAYADDDKNIRLEAGIYRLGVVMGVQPSAAGFLLDDHGTGTPQRFVFVSGTHPDVSDVDIPEWPGQLQWKPIRHGDLDGGLLDVAASIVAELRARHVAVVTGKVNDPLQAHAGLRQLKCAAAFALLDSRASITDEDWQLAAALTETGDAARDRLRADLQRERQMREQASDERAGRRRLSELRAEEQVAEQRIQRGAEVLCKRLAKVGHPMVWRELRDALGSQYGNQAAIREYAVDKGMIVATGDGLWTVA